MRDPHCEGGEGAPREGHDFPTLGEGASAAFRGEGPAHAEGCKRGGGGEGAFLRDRNRKGLRSPHPETEPRSRHHPIFVPPAEPKEATPAPAAAPLPLTCGHRCMHGGPQPRVPRRAGEGGRPLLPPARARPSPGRLRSRRRRRGCPLLQCESRRRAGPGPGRLGNHDSTWRGAARRRAHPPSGPLPGAAPRAQPRRGAAEAGGCVAAVTRYAGPSPGTRVAGGGREVSQPGGSGGGAAARSQASGLPGCFPGPRPQRCDLRRG